MRMRTNIRSRLKSCATVSTYLPYCNLTGRYSLSLVDHLPSASLIRRSTSSRVGAQGFSTLALYQPQPQMHAGDLELCSRLDPRLIVPSFEPRSRPVLAREGNFINTSNLESRSSNAYPPLPLPPRGFENCACAPARTIYLVFPPSRTRVSRLLYTSAVD